MRGLYIPLLLFLSGCEQSFDERYSETEQQLKEDARQLEKDMAAETAPARAGTASIASRA